ncbi:glycosyltransferase family 9 protein [Deltaproteobacteria bacterium IMCC39524]|nr:glycosyltransferase family 9 protein [Deltaproteobacteria bacterium IMCC39524]
MKILIYRPDNIGDVVLFSGALKHIRRHYPGAFITIAVKTHVRDVLELCPHVDKCISLDQLSWTRVTRWFTSKSQILFGCVMRLQGLFNNCFSPYDLVIYPVKSPQVVHLRQLHKLGYRSIVGMTGSDSCQPKGGYPAELEPINLFTESFDTSVEDPWRHEILTTIDFLNYLGCSIKDVNDVTPEFWFSPSDKNLLENYSVKGKKVVGVFPGAADVYRCWDVANYQALAKDIKGDIIYVLLGSESDKRIGSEVEKALYRGCDKCCVVNLIGKTTLRELSLVIKECDLFIGMETSGLHIAIALDISSVGIVGGGHFGRFVPWGNPKKHKILTKRMECFHCNWICIKSYVECIQDVSSSDVAASANRFLH